MLSFEAEFYKSLFGSLDNNAVIRERNQDGVFVPTICTREFADMMECEPQQFIEIENDEPLCTVYPEDREEAEYFFNNGRTRDGSNHLVIRKRTMKGHIVWVDMHYAFFEYNGRDYAYCNYYNITQLKENEQQLENQYNGLKEELGALAGESLVSFRANITEDKIEEISGKDLFGFDRADVSYGEMIRMRAKTFPLERDSKKFINNFNTLNLLSAYNSGKNSVSEVFYSKRQNGNMCFVKFTAILRKDPISADITVFGTETNYNSEKVEETLDSKILARQYDMITYLVDGKYGVVIGDASLIEKGSIFPRERSGSYEDYIKNQVIPVAYEEENDREELSKALSPDTIEKELEKGEPYSVNVACDIDGGIYYKRFDFFVVDSEAKFYILLKSDFTELQKEQAARNEQLKEALEEAKQASVAKTAFLSRMSHEIRTPMNAIIGLDTIALQEADLEPGMKDNLEKIGKSAKYLLSLINDILDMSRIESGRMVLKNEDFSFRDFIEQINTIVYSQCQDKGLSYDCFIHGKPDEHYIGDAMKLKQVIINILGNAVKFTEAPGNVNLTVEVVSRADKYSKLKFIVKDTGIGMDAEYIPKIFDAFSQEDATNTNRYGGSGLGMAISKNIITMMNGDIKVDSVKGEGSTFTIEVALKNSDVGRTKTLKEANIKPEDLKILVVDDDPVACQHARIVLGEAGFESETCMNKQQALELINLYHARREDFNLCLVDLRMPEDDGIAVTKAIREAIGHDTTVIILTAYNWQEIEDEALDAGVDGFMRKPLYGDDVIIEFHNALRRRQINAQNNKREVDIRGKRILLAEDMEINAEIMKKLLEMKEADADIAGNGQIAVDMFKEHEDNYYDAILMDIRMPVLDGLGATEAIRAIGTQYAESVPIIAMTANAFDEDVQRSLKAGMDAHLSKPVEPEKLYETLDVFIRDGREKNSVGGGGPLES